MLLNFGGDPDHDLDPRIFVCSLISLFVRELNCYEHIFKNFILLNVCLSPTNAIILLPMHNCLLCFCSKRNDIWGGIAF